MLRIGDKVFRNLQEQVGYNSEQIDKIFEFLDGLNVQDNLIKLTASSGTLNAEEMAVVEKDVAFIIYNDNLYIKTTTSASEYTFKQVALSASDQGTYNILQSFRIVITKANGAYLYSSNTVLALYNKTEMDSLLSAKADQSVMTSALAGKADLAGANFTGPITSPSIIENMSGYFFQKATLDDAHRTISYTYAGAVKNGNKLTVAVAGTILTKDSSSNTYVGSMVIPASVGAKLFPNTIGGIPNILEVKSIVMTATGYSMVSCPATIFKPSGTELSLSIYGLGSLTQGTTYYWRIEATFLLSDSLL